MTKKQITAVKKTIKQWAWLRDNPDKFKEDYFKERGIIGRPPIYRCYLCPIWYAHCMGCRSGCPLDAPGLVCNVDSNNPYEEWESGVEKEKNAQRIINACKRWLKKYDH